VTTLGILHFDESGEMFLYSIHPGVTLEQVQASTGWPLRVAAELRETAAPTEAELAVLRRLNPGEIGGARE
jgi:glutaconate CoA-transferase subunit B